MSSAGAGDGCLEIGERLLDLAIEVAVERLSAQGRGIRFRSSAGLLRSMRGAIGRRDPKPGKYGSGPVLICRLKPGANSKLVPLSCPVPDVK